MPLKLNLRHKSLILVGIPLIFELVFVSTLTWLLFQSEQEKAKEARAREVLSHVSLTESLLASAALNLAGHLGPSLPETNFNSRLAAIMKRMDDEFSTLRQLAKGDPQEVLLIARLEQLARDALAKDRQANRLFEQGKFEEGGAALTDVRVLFEKIRGITTGIVDKLEQIITAAPGTQAERRKIIQNILFAGMILNILIAALLAAYFNQSTSRRLNVLIDNTLRLAKHQELNPPVKGSDEIAHLDQFFHGMATDLANAERVKQEYVAMISQDLRLPLTSIKSALSNVMNGVYGTISEGGLKRVKGAESNAERLISLINTLLDLEKLEAGKIELSLSDIQTSHVIDRSIEAVFSLAELSGVKIETTGEDFTLYADGGRLVQVLVNLLSNAIKFSPRGSVVTVTAEAQSGYVEVRVIDRGRGIPESHLNAVFDRFQQVEEADAKQKGGTGLGLAICKAIIEGHGGTIGVESEFGKGSTFWLRLPAKNEDCLTAATATLESEEPGV